MAERWLNKGIMRTSNLPLRKKSPLLLLVLLLSLQALVKGAAQPEQTFSNIGVAMEAIRQTFNVSTGFENTIGDLDNTPVKVDLSGDDVARVFDALIAQRPAYVWSLKDGFYDVYPKMKADSFSQLIVANYVVTDASLIEAVDAIDKLPNVQRWFSSRHVTRGNLISGIRPMPSPPQRKRSLALKNVPIRTILNRVYGNFGETHWVIWHEGKNITMFFTL
jgi:hypothetical protein